MTVSTDELLNLLKASNDFKALELDVLKALSKAMTIKTIAGGDKFISEGEDAESLFLLVSGRLRVSRTLTSGEQLLYNEVLPGDSIGETSMILRQTRTADISATRDSVIAELSYDAYQKLVSEFPIELNRAFSNAIYRQLRHERQVEKRKRAQSFYLLPIHQSVQVDDFVSQFTKSLQEHGRVEVVRQENNEDLNQLGKQLDTLEASEDFIVFQGAVNFDKRQQLFFEHADQLILIADSEQSTKLTEVEQSLKSHPSFALMRRHLAVIHSDHSNLSTSRLEWNESRQAERIYPMKPKQQQDYARLCRFLLEKAVGLVLGGGGARGFAHLGVLKAFEEFNIPVDIIGGNSMGALIGASYVAGIPREQIHLEILKHAKGGMKITFPAVSLMSNKNLAGAFQTALGDVNIEQLWTPFFAAACNLTDAETAVLDRGPLWKAVLASNSPAGLFPPVINDGALLVDGAILENVPVQAMRQRLSNPLERRRGNGLVIAIDVDVKGRLSVDNEVTELSTWKKVKSHFTSKQTTLPGIVDILMQVAHIGGLSQRPQTKRGADIYLEPPLSNFKIMDYKKAEEIIEVGYQFTKERIQELKEQAGI